ncbi:MAG: dipeptidyl peptidase 3 [Saprospiraceae bacterium]|nr:dipeptidyl peptidase 3 [Saprospiraceae bacterium]MDW8484056.1 dihydrofolate reductase [Saprospiraceae bacterium]
MKKDSLEERIILDSFADIQILRYDLPGWDELTLRQKIFIYYLSEAALAGRDIIYDQHCKYNLTVRKTLEAIFETWKGDRNTPEWKAFETYAKRVWFSNGIHHHYNETKILPEFSFEYFARLVNGADPKALPLSKDQTPTALLDTLRRVMFDTTFLPKRTNKAADVDVVLTSAVHFYENITAEEVDRFYQQQLRAAGDRPPLVGLNSKLIGVPGGKPYERVWRAGDGMYGPAIDKIIENLEKALPYAENEQQKEVIRLLIAYYRTGDLRKFDEYNIAWVRDTASMVDFINGFIEVYHDPKGYKGDWEAVVQYNDPEASRKMAIISRNAQYFEDNSPIPAAYRKKEAKGISYRVINVAMEGGACAPSTPIGINLPNSEWIRAHYGSKSISLNNIENAYARSGGAVATAEFAHDEEEIALAKQYGELVSKVHTALHEVIGHASGQLKPGVPQPSATLKQYASTIEETRADLVALYFLPDPKLVEWGILPDTLAYRTGYDYYLRNGLLQQLRRIQPGQNIEQDHMRNRHLISSWVLEQAQRDSAVVKVVRNGKTYFDIRNYARVRELFGKLLAEVQRIKSEGDFNAARRLVETYGIRVDPALVQQVRERYASLPTKPYSGFVQPRLLLIKDEKGNILDVRATAETDFVQQMLRYGREYAFLPVRND